MSEIIIDLTNYKDRVGSRVDPGTYTVVVEDAELDKSRAGNPMINLYLRVVGGEHDGATIVDRLTQSEKAMFRTVNFLQALGVNTPRKRFKLNIGKFIGKRLNVEVDDGEPYNGRVKSEVRGNMKLKAAAEDEADEADLDDVDSAPEPEPEPEEPDTTEDDQGPADEPETPKLAKETKKSDPEPEAEAPEEVDLDDIEL